MRHADDPVSSPQIAKTLGASNEVKSPYTKVPRHRCSGPGRDTTEVYSAMPPKRIPLICERCGSTFMGQRYRRKPSDGPRRFCSVTCRYAGGLTDRATAFWTQVDKSGECWLWTGGQRHQLGYGGFWSGKQWMGAHRFSYELHYGQIPAGLFVCHRCDVPACVRPDHLFAGTQAENVADMIAKGRQNFTRKPRIKGLET